jgi:hypothetical protein
VPICRDKGKFGAICAHTRGETKATQIPKLKWDQMRMGMFCMDAKALGDYRAFVEKACQQNSNCVEGVRRILDALDEPAADKPVKSLGGNKI